MCSDMKSHAEYISSTEAAGMTPSCSITELSTNGSNAITSMPRALAFAATSLPTFPYACIPTFLPWISLPVPGVKQLRDMYIIMAIASSATALEFCPGVFITTMPRCVQASRQMLSYPAPARTTILSFPAASMTSLVILSERTISASASATASSSLSAEGYFSRRTVSCPPACAISLIPFTAAAANGFSVATSIFMSVWIKLSFFQTPACMRPGPLRSL